MRSDASSVLTMPSDDWPRQQWARMTRLLLGVKAPRRRGGMRHAKRSCQSNILRSALACVERELHLRVVIAMMEPRTTLPCRMTLPGNTVFECLFVMLYVYRKHSHVHTSCACQFRVNRSIVRFPMSGITARARKGKCCVESPDWISKHLSTGY